MIKYNGDSQENVNKISTKSQEKKGYVNKTWPHLTHAIQLNENTNDCNSIFSSVAWVDGDRIAIVDQKKETLNIISKIYSEVKSVVISNCTEISSFKEGMLCRTTQNNLHILSSSLTILKTFPQALTMLTSNATSSKPFG